MGACAQHEGCIGPVNRIKDCLTEEELGIIVRAMYNRLVEGGELPGVAHVSRPASKRSGRKGIIL